MARTQGVGWEGGWARPFLSTSPFSPSLPPFCSAQELRDVPGPPNKTKERKKLCGWWGVVVFCGPQIASCLHQHREYAHTAGMAMLPSVGSKAFLIPAGAQVLGKAATGTSGARVGIFKAPPPPVSMLATRSRLCHCGPHFTDEEAEAERWRALPGRDQERLAALTASLARLLPGATASAEGGPGPVPHPHGVGCSKPSV